MTPWFADATKRMVINEGLKLNRYLDSRGIPTIGIGYNCTRGVDPLVACGIPNPHAVVAGDTGITESQAYCLFNNDFAFAVSDADASLRKGIYNALSDARRFVIADLCYNMGLATWLGFITTRQLIESAEKAKQAGDAAAHQLFVEAGEHLKASAYYTQTGDRAKRNVAMLTTGIYCKPDGDGSDIF